MEIINLENKIKFLKSTNSISNDLLNKEFNIIFDNNSIINQFTNLIYYLPSLLHLFNKVIPIENINIYTSYPIPKYYNCSIKNINNVFSKIHKPTYYDNTLEKFLKLIQFVNKKEINNSTLIFILGNYAEADDDKKNVYLNLLKNLFPIIFSNNKIICIKLDNFQNSLTSCVISHFPSCIYTGNDFLIAFNILYFSKYSSLEFKITNKINSKEENITFNKKYLLIKEWNFDKELDSINLESKNDYVKILEILEEVILDIYSDINNIKDDNLEIINCISEIFNNVSKYLVNSEYSKRLSILEWNILIKKKLALYNKFTYLDNNICKNNLETLINKYSIKSLSYCNYFNKKDKHYNKFDKKCIEYIESEHKKYSKLSHDQNLEITKFVEYLELEDSDSFTESKEFYNSSISLTNWIDEISNNNFTGLLMNISIDEFIKINNNKKNMFVNINSISSNFLSYRDFIEMTFDYFEKNNSDYGNLNYKNIIKENINGDYNSIIPIYIHKIHWNIAKKNIPFILGIILSHNPFGFLDSYYNFYFYLLNYMNTLIFDSENKTSNSLKFIKVYFAIWRTCSQIAYEKGYHRGIYTKIEEFNDYLLLNKYNSYNLESILGQIISTPLVNNLEEHLLNIITGAIKYYISKHIIISSDYFELLFTYDNIIKKYTLNIQSLNTISYTIQEKLSMIFISLINFEKIILIINDLIKSKGSFKKFIEYLDSNYSILSDEDCKLVISKITKNKCKNLINFQYIFKNNDPLKFLHKIIFDIAVNNYTTSYSNIKLNPEKLQNFRNNICSCNLLYKEPKYLVDLKELPDQNYNFLETYYLPEFYNNSQLEFYVNTFSNFCL
jgi:hypothetical protein